MTLSRSILYLLLAFGATNHLCAQSSTMTLSGRPETVLATFRVKPDQMPEFLKLMPAYWAALRAEHLVLDAPHVMLQGEENGKPVFFEVFSWRDHDAPEHVPPAIQQYWDRINRMVESRDGHPGIEFPEMKLVTPR